METDCFRKSSTSLALYPAKTNPQTPMLLERDGLNEEIFNIAEDAPITLNELADSVGKATEVFETIEAPLADPFF